MKKLTSLAGAVLLILVLALSGCQDAAPVNDANGDAEVVVEVTASNYAFEPEIITVEKGQIVRIELTITEGTHDMVVDEFNAATSAAGAGSTVAVEFEASQSGDFEYYCSVGNHRALGMVGTLIVEDE